MRQKNSNDYIKSYNKQYTKPYYNYTSEAYDYDIYTYPTSLPKKRIVKKKKIKYIKSEVNVNWLSFKFILSLSILFIFTTLLLSLQGELIQAQNSIENLNKELKNIYEDNNYLTIELSKNLDLNEIEQLAINKLGMQYPTSSQTVYINVPKESYTVKNEDISNTKNNFLFNFLSNLNLKSLFSN